MIYRVFKVKRCSDLETRIRQKVGKGKVGVTKEEEINDSDLRRRLSVGE